MFSIMTIASSTTKPVAMVSDISDRLSIEKPNRYMPARVPVSDSGTDRLGMNVAGRLRRNTKITSTTRAIESSSSNSTSETEARIVVVWSERIRTSRAAGRVCSSFGSSAFTELTTASTFDPGWRWILTMIAGVLLAQAASSAFCAPSTTLATSRKSYRVAVFVAQNEVAIFLGALQLIVVVDRGVLRRPVEIAFRRVGIVVGDVGADVVDGDAIGGQGAWVDLHAHRGAHAAGEADQAHATQLRQLLRDAHIGEIFHLRQLERLWT